MKYKVNDEIFDSIDNVLDYCIEDGYHYDDDYFGEWVNDNWGSITIDGFEYYAYDILDNAGDLDSVRDTYAERMNEDDREEAGYQLRHASPGEYVECQRYDIEVLPDEEEPEENDRNETLELTRQFIEDMKCLEESAKAEEQQHELDFMELFQVIK